MLPIDELKPKELHKARRACAYVFSPQLAKSDAFLKRIDIDMLRKAYRKKAKKYHPDLYSHEKEELVKKRKDCFVKIKESYETLSAYLQKKTPLFAEKNDGKGIIIAVGGAKGGIGKSLFTANLGVFLSNSGLKTVVVDLDLGGANLHLYLGETLLEWSVNDFLNKRVASLETIISNNRFGPLLIGGDSSQLGSANINYLVKLKLLKAIRNLPADVILIDLGGDTSYNMLDFFLLAHRRIVMTTCDPASYLDAYNFIKTALYRKLNRLFGPESRFRSRKDSQLEKIIHEATLSMNGSQVATIQDLLDQVQKQLPNSLPLISEAISSYSPYLLINRVPSHFDELQVVERVQAVSSEMLSIKVKHLGSLPYQSDIESSARNLVPIIAKYPKGDLAHKMSCMVEGFLCNN